jgi:hypothetical protein
VRRVVAGVVVLAGVGALLPPQEAQEALEVAVLVEMVAMSRAAVVAEVGAAVWVRELLWELSQI